MHHKHGAIINNQITNTHSVSWGKQNNKISLPSIFVFSFERQPCALQDNIVLVKKIFLNKYKLS